MSFTPLDQSTSSAPTSGFTPLDQLAPTSAPTAAPAAPTPGFFSQLASSFFSGFNTGTDIISPAKQFAAGQQQIDQPFIDKSNSPTGFTPIQALEGATQVGAGLFTKLSAPLAPIFGPISKAFEFIGNLDEKIASKAQPGLEEWAATPQGAQTIRAVNDINNAAQVLQVAVGGVEGIKALTRGEVPTTVPTEGVRPPPEAPPETPTPKIGQEVSPVTERPSTAKTAPEPAPIEPVKAPVAPQEPASEALPPKTAEVAAPQIEAPPSPKTVSPPSTPKTEPAPALKTEPGVSRIGKSIEAKAIEQGLTEGFDTTARYNVKNVPDQIKRTSEFVANNIDEARAIIRGETPVPDGMSPVMLIDAMEKYQKLSKDGTVAHELANSPLTSGSSYAAQEMRLAQERTPDSATAKLQEIRTAKQEAAGGDKKVAARRNQLVKGLKAEQGKINLPKEDLYWKTFLDSITC